LYITMDKAISDITTVIDLFLVFIILSMFSKRLFYLIGY
jgi:hypothetical protein